MKRRFLAVLSVLILLSFCVIPASLAAGSTYVGTWVCVAVSGLDGEMQTMYNGNFVSDISTMRLNVDGMASVTSYGVFMDGTWEETEKGISLAFNGSVVDFAFEDNQLIVRDGSVASYMEKQENAIWTITLGEVDGQLVLKGPDGNVHFSIVPSESATPVVIPAATEEPAHGSSVDTQKIITSLFGATFPKKGWVINHGEQSDALDYCRLKMEYKDTNGSTVAAFTLTALSASVRDYRIKLKQLTEFAQKAGKESPEERKIGGINFAGIASSYQGVNYMDYVARIPESSITILVEVEEPQIIISDLNAILDSITFSLPTLLPPNVDPPQTEDGTP